MPTHWGLVTMLAIARLVIIYGVAVMTLLSGPGSANLRQRISVGPAGRRRRLVSGRPFALA